MQLLPENFLYKQKCSSLQSCRHTISHSLSINVRCRLMSVWPTTHVEQHIWNVVTVACPDHRKVLFSCQFMSLQIIRTSLWFKSKDTKKKQQFNTHIPNGFLFALCASRAIFRMCIKCVGDGTKVPMFRKGTMWRHWRRHIRITGLSIMIAGGGARM